MLLSDRKSVAKHIAILYYYSMISATPLHYALKGAIIMLSRKKILSLLIICAMCFSLIPPQPAMAADENLSASEAQALYASVKDQLQSITYEGLYDTFAYNATSDVKKNNMEKLGMRSAFDQAMRELDVVIPKVLENTSSRTATASKINTYKLDIMLGLTYLYRYYNFTANGIPIKDYLLFSPEKLGWHDVEALSILTTLGGLAYGDIDADSTSNTYYSKLSYITGIDGIDALIEHLAKLDGCNSTNEYFQKESKALFAEAGENSNFFEKMKNVPRLTNWMLPLLGLSSESLYIVSTDHTVTVGMVSAYGDPQDAAFQSMLQSAAKKQQAFLDFWKRTSQTKDKLTINPEVLLVDTLAVKGEGGTQARWSAEYGEAADPGVREFIAPMGHYRACGFALPPAAEADPTANFIRYFGACALTDTGINGYTHELTHLYDNTVWLNGHGRRDGVGGETFATGLFESENNTQKADGGSSSYGPIFSLNTAYELGDNRLQNKSPERFQTSADLKEYMQGVMDVIYTLDVIEAEEILKLHDEDKAQLLNRVELVEDAAHSSCKQDSFSYVTAEEAAQFRSIDDLVDGNIVSGRLAPKEYCGEQVISHNAYLTVPMFEGVYAGLQNDEGSVGGFLFRRYAYELLGEYGWEDGFIAYISNQYGNDGNALKNILPSQYNGSLKEFKKAMLQRRADKIEHLKAVPSYADAEAMRQAISEALQTDLAAIKSGKTNAPTYYLMFVTAVQQVKTDIFQEYLLMTDDFRESIYRDVAPKPEPDPTPDVPDPEPNPDAPTDTPDDNISNPSDTPTTPEIPQDTTDVNDANNTSAATKPVLNAPKTVTAILFGHDDVTLSWPAIADADGYHISYKRSSWKEYRTLGTTTKTTYQKKNLADGVKYQFKVTPYTIIDGKHLSGTSSTASLPLYTLKKLKKPTIKKISKKHAVISWKKAKGADGYQIARSAKKTKSYKTLKTVKGNKAKYKFKIKKYKTYYYRLRPYTTVNGKKIYGPWSAPVRIL